MRSGETLVGVLIITRLPTASGFLADSIWAAATSLHAASKVKSFSQEDTSIAELLTRRYSRELFTDPAIYLISAMRRLS